MRAIGLPHAACGEMARMRRSDDGSIRRASEYGDGCTSVLASRSRLLACRRWSLDTRARIWTARTLWVFAILPWELGAWVCVSVLGSAYCNYRERLTVSSHASSTCGTMTHE